MLIQEKKRITLRFTNPILGSAPANKQFYQAYLLEKLNKEIDLIERKISNGKGDTEALLSQKKYLEEQLSNLPDIEDNEDYRLTIFYRGRFEDYQVPVIRAHQILGFLKEAGNNFKDTLGIKALRDKISKYVRIYPFDIYIFDGEIKAENLVDDVDDILERPLMALTPRGKRVSIARSEMIKSDGDKLIQFEIIILKNKEVSYEVINELWEYGRYNGIGQWRNSGQYGSFEVVDVL